MANTVSPSRGWEQVTRTIEDGRIVILDGGIGSELQEVGYPPKAAERPANFTWGSIAIAEAPEKLVEVHRRYAEVGADVLETHTFALNRVYSAIQDGRIDLPKDSWKDLALRSVELVREGAKQAGREDAAVAFACRTMDWLPLVQENARPDDNEEHYHLLDMENYLRPLAETLANAPAHQRPDVVLMEIQKEIPADLEFPDYQLFLDTGIPLWVSYRRTIGKVVGVEGQTIVEDGDLFGRAAAKFEEMGIDATLVNCLPPEQVAGVGQWLRQYTGMTLGAYPNMGEYIRYEWNWDNCPTPEQIGEMAKGWADEGMQVIGGCCGARPAHIAELVRLFK